MTRPRSKLSPHFFHREPDGSVRLRLRFTPEEAALIEEAAGTKPLLLYIHHVLNDRARFHVSRRQLYVDDTLFDDYEDDFDDEDDENEEKKHA